MFGDLIIPVDSLSISLGMGLSITLKAGVKLPGWLWGSSHSSVARAPAAKAGGSGFNSQWLPWVFSLPAGLLMLLG